MRSARANPFQRSQAGPGTQKYSSPAVGVVIAVDAESDTLDVAELGGGNRVWFGLKPGDMITPEGGGMGLMPTIGTKVNVDMGGAGGKVAVVRGGTGGAPSGPLYPGDVNMRSSGGGGMRSNSDGSTESGRGLGQTFTSRDGTQTQYNKTLDLSSLGGGIKSAGTAPGAGAGLTVSGNEKAGDSGGGAALILGGADGAVLASRAPGSGASAFPAVSIAPSTDPVASAAAAKALMGAVKALQKLGSDGIALLAGALGVSLGGPKIALVADAEITLSAPSVKILGALSIGPGAGGGGPTIMDTDLKCKKVDCGAMTAVSISAPAGAAIPPASNEDLKFLITKYNTHTHPAPGTVPASIITGIPTGLPQFKG